MDCWRVQLLKKGSHISKPTNKFLPKARERANRMVLDHENEYGAAGGLSVASRLKQDASIHRHELLAPCEMDGVPGVSFPGICPGETFTYKYAVSQVIVL